MTFKTSDLLNYRQLYPENEKDFEEQLGKSLYEGMD